MVSYNFFDTKWYKEENMEINTNLILNYMKEHGLGRADFCKLCKIENETLDKIFGQDFDFDISALFKIARVLDLEVCQLFA